MVECARDSAMRLQTQLLALRVCVGIGVPASSWSLQELDTKNVCSNGPSRYNVRCCGEPNKMDKAGR